MKTGLAPFLNEPQFWLQCPPISPPEEAEEAPQKASKKCTRMCNGFGLLILGHGRNKSSPISLWPGIT